MASRPEPARYRFGPLERRGLVAGWRGGQVACVTAGLVVAVGLLRSEPPPLDVLTALAAVVLSIGVATWPIAGRTGEQWCPVVVAWMIRALGGGRRHLSSVPTLGSVAPVRAHQGTWRAPGPTTPGAAPAPGWRPRGGLPGALPGALRGCRLLAPPVGGVGGLRLGVIHDARARTYTGVVAVSGSAFALLELDERHRRVAAWSSLLASLAREGSPVHRLQWLQRELPGEPSELTTRMCSRMVLPPEAPAARSYAEVVERAARLARSHQVLLALSIRADRSGREVRALGGGDEGACALLIREVRALLGALGGAEVLVQGALSPRMLTSTLRQAIEAWPRGSFTPVQVGHAAESGQPAEADQPADPRIYAWPWPIASETSWATHRTETTWHATYWIAEWPRVDVGPDFLAPLLLHSGVRHTMAVTMEPISPLKAARDVQQARTADLADAEIRRRGGFLTSARRGREAQAVNRREVELADGHAEYRFSGYVTVTARSSEALDADCARIEQAAGHARLELRRLYGQQDEAFTFTLPLGRGLS